jgi:surfeit locus 1 family protein
MLARFVSRRWLLATLLVLAASAVMARLGIWQLDRLTARQAFNARVLEQSKADVLTLDQAALANDLYSMEYRRVMVTGRYLPEDEIVLRNQVWQTEFGTQLGVKLFTPLLIEGTDAAILVERGWIPDEDAELPGRAKYAEDTAVTVLGQLRRAETSFTFNLHPDPTLSPDQTRLETWNNLDLDRLSAQMNVDLLPVYLQRIPERDQTDPPFAAIPQLDLSEGSHFGYAVQWFSFAAILLVGYVVYLTRQEEKNGQK